MVRGRSESGCELRIRSKIRIVLWVIVIKILIVEILIVKILVVEILIIHILYPLKGLCYHFTTFLPKNQ